ncbi:MAG: fibrobacter succinogenes major paralogous domain-containing protein [Chitinispirillales bacterium]|jgi:uncharacterized protein (TIGR02145 family)|nr:fibrobacter succinogenes major paralogous domain-containing protein [Chitinispirillales bacterium]
MKIFKQLCRTFVLSAVAVALSVGLMGCVVPGWDVPDDTPFDVDNRCGVDGTAGSCRTVVIGGQTWMAENLNYQTADSWCYDDKADNCVKYGRLYTWAAAKIACNSVGWKLPDTADWDKLVDAAGGYDNAGKALKSKFGWNGRYNIFGRYNNGNGTDDYGFSALPGGYRYSDAPFSAGCFDHAGRYGNWWTATEDDHDSANYDAAYYLSMGYSGIPQSDCADCVYERSGDKSYDFSVRCVQDE